MFYSWEGNHRCGITLAMHQRLVVYPPVDLRCKEGRWAPCLHYFVGYGILYPKPKSNCGKWQPAKLKATWVCDCEWVTRAAEGDQSAENNAGAALWTASPGLLFFIHFVLKWTVAGHCTCGSWLKGLEEEGEHVIFMDPWNTHNILRTRENYRYIDVSYFIQQFAVV